MISTRLMLNNVEYIVRAKNKAELDKAVQFLYNCDEPEMALLESQLDAPEVPAEPAIETRVEEPKQAPKRSNAPKAPKAPAKRKPADSKTVNLGGMGKSE